MDDCYFHASLTTQPRSFPPSEEPDNWVTTIEGEITATEFDSESDIERECLAAKTTWHFVDCQSAGESGVSPWLILDAHSRNISSYADLYEPTSQEFRSEIEEMFRNQIWSLNLLIADRLEICPTYRRRGITGWLFEEMPRVFGINTQIIAIKPFPLQFEVAFKERDTQGNRFTEWENSLELEKFEVDAEKATSALFKYYATFGFVRAPGLDLMLKRTPE